jgi:uncharacterized membrane protein
MDGIVIWIGGVAMVTTVVLPAVRRGDLGADRLRAFEALERRFAWQARLAVIVAGLSGLYMTARLDAWDRFNAAQLAQFWWMHAMVCLWLIFALILFVAEPLVLHRRLPLWAAKAPETTFAWLHRAHWVLFILGLVTILGAVAGSQGWSAF